MWIKLLFFAISGGLLFKQILEPEIAKRGALHWFILIFSSLCLIALGGDIAYHYITHDPERIGSLRFVARKLGIEDRGAAALDCPSDPKSFDNLPKAQKQECALVEAKAADALQYKRAVAIGTAESFAEYVKACDLCVYKTEATAQALRISRLAEVRLDDEHFEDARRVNTFGAYSQYVNTCKVCRHVDLARLEIKSFEAASSLKQQPIEGPASGVSPRHRGRFALTRGIALDTNSGLMWRRCALGMTMTQGTCAGTPEQLTIEQADDRIKDYSAEGYSDWRLPTDAELWTLVDRQIGDQVTGKLFIDEEVFPRLARTTGGNVIYLARRADQTGFIKCAAVNFVVPFYSHAYCWSDYPKLLVRGKSSK